MFYDGYKTLSHNCLFNFVVGNRGCGKTYWSKRWAINDFLENGAQFVYVRRFDTELKNLKNFFNDIKIEFPNVEFSVEGRTIFINNRVAGYGLALSNAKVQKSTSFPEVNKIIFDEFILDKGYHHYIPDEVINFLELYETVARMRDVRVMFLSNSITMANPYFLYFDLNLPYGKKVHKKGDLLLELVANEEFIEAKKKTRFGQLISNTDYGKYAIENVFLRDNTTFVKKIDESMQHIFNIKWKGEIYGVWCTKGIEKVYVCEKTETGNLHPTYSLTKDDHTELTFFFDTFKKTRDYRIFKESFSNGYLYFQNNKCKTASFEVLTKMSM